MKIFWRYIFPALYGLMVYFTIRLLLDSVTGMKFWHRTWQLNTLEMSASIVMGFFYIWVLHHLFSWFDRKWGMDFSSKRIIREFGYVMLVSLVIPNIFLLPIAAFTDDGLQWHDFVDINTVPTLYTLIYYGIRRSTFYLQAYIQNRLQLEKITNDQLQTELKFLRAQYHPHFLFNALNTVYFQMDVDIKAAKKTVESFSELLRYQLYDQQQKVPVSNEVQYLQHFIDLQQVRASRKLQLQTRFDDSFQEELIYPLLFLPLVENAFKYVGGSYRIDIQLKKEAQEICFGVENSIPENTPAQRTGGIGLENLKRRLELLYPGKHTLTAGAFAGNYLAELKLALS